MAMPLQMVLLGDIEIVMSKGDTAKGILYPPSFLKLRNRMN